MRIIKITKNQDLAEITQMIKQIKEREMVFEMEKGSPLLISSANMKLVKKIGEAMGKKIRIRTDDPIGRVLALKAEVLDGEIEQVKPAKPGIRVKRSDVKPRFSDIVVSKRPHAQAAAAVPVAASAIKKVATEHIRHEPETYTHSETRTKSRGFRSSFSKIFVITMVVLVLGVFGLSVLLPQATITVYARSERITRDVEVTLDKSAPAVDQAKLTAPATVITREVSQTKNFPATGTKDVGTKATGTVQIYNFTKNTLTLRASTTTLVAPNGKRFNFTKDITGIRPTAVIGAGEESEVDQSTLIPPVAVVAQASGPDYNLGANIRFTIQNAALGSTNNVYATSPAAFSGGTTKNVKVVSQQDLDQAVTALTGSIAAQAETDLNTERGTDSDLKILPNGITREVLAHTANKNVGAEAESFDMTMIAKITGLQYKESDIKNIIVTQINSVLSSDKYLLPDADEAVNASFKSLDLPNGRGVLSVHFETVAAYRVNADDMSKLLAGKNAIEIKEILLAKPEIDRVDVEFSPFFVNKAPKLNGKIYIHSMLSEG